MRSRCTAMFLCVFITALLPYFLQIHPYTTYIFAMNFFIVSVVVLGAEAQKVNNKQTNYFATLKLPNSSVQSVLNTVLLSKFPLINNIKSFPCFQDNVPHLILPCLLDLDTLCTVHEFRILMHASVFYA